MRQVPNYAIIGNGRMANHICHYFDYLSIRYQRWYRSAHNYSQLDSILSSATHVLVLISDGAIESFVQKHILKKHSDLITIHFSGCLSTSVAFSSHPLQTFKQDEIYSLDEYQRIPFVIDKHAPDFSTLLPGLDNPHYRIAAEDKPYYHAMCVLANNVTTLLWQKFYREMSERFGVEQKDVEPYLQRTLANIQANPETALTGPIARKDLETLDKNLTALSGDPFHPIFEAVIKQFALGD